MTVLSFLRRRCVGTMPSPANHRGETWTVAILVIPGPAQLVPEAIHLILDGLEGVPWDSIVTTCDLGCVVQELFRLMFRAPS